MIPAVFLTAGVGSRLGEHTRTTPKPVLDVDGVPLVAYTLWSFAQQGITDAFLNLHHLPAVLRAQLARVELPGLRLHFTDETALRGTAGTVVDFVLREQPTQSCLVVYGDLLLAQPLAPMLAQHRSTGALLTLLVHPTQGSNSVVEFADNGAVTRFVERPPPGTPRGKGPLWANSGCYLVEPDVMRALSRDVPLDFPRDVFPGVLQQGRLYAHRLNGYRCAVDSQERLMRARADMRAGAMPRPRMRGGNT